MENLQDEDFDKLMFLFVERIEKCNDLKEKKKLQIQLQKLFNMKIEQAVIRHHSANLNINFA